MAEENKQEEIKVEENKAEATEQKVEEAPKKEKKDAKVQKLKEEVARLERELKEEKEKNLKEIAEMQTTKRRLKEESINDRKYASMKVVSELIGPIDMLVKIVNGPAPSEEIKNYQIGFQMIANQLLGVLETEGLKEISCKADDEYNPVLMQAVTTEEQEGLDSSKVLKVLQTGYMYKDRVLKPTMVHVAVPKKIEEKQEENKEEQKGE